MLSSDVSEDPKAMCTLEVSCNQSTFAPAGKAFGSMFGIFKLHPNVPAPAEWHRSYLESTGHKRESPLMAEIMIFFLPPPGLLYGEAAACAAL